MRGYAQTLPNRSRGPRHLHADRPIAGRWRQRRPRRCISQEAFRQDADAPCQKHAQAPQARTTEGRPAGHRNHANGRKASVDREAEAEQARTGEADHDNNYPDRKPRGNHHAHELSNLRPHEPDLHEASHNAGAHLE